jgi:hypothetical protein
MAAILPSSQFVHALPVDGWYLPVGQFVHSDAATEAYRPFAHAAQAAAL